MAQRNLITLTGELSVGQMAARIKALKSAIEPTRNEITELVKQIGILDEKGKANWTKEEQKQYNDFTKQLSNTRQVLKDLEAEVAQNAKAMSALAKIQVKGFADSTGAELQRAIKEIDTKLKSFTGKTEKVTISIVGANDTIEKISMTREELEKLKRSAQTELKVRMSGMTEPVKQAEAWLRTYGKMSAERRDQMAQEQAEKEHIIQNYEEELRAYEGQIEAQRTLAKRFQEEQRQYADERNTLLSKYPGATTSAVTDEAIAAKERELGNQVRKRERAEQDLAAAKQKAVAAGVTEEMMEKGVVTAAEKAAQAQQQQNQAAQQGVQIQQSVATIINQSVEATNAAADAQAKVNAEKQKTVTLTKKQAEAQIEAANTTINSVQGSRMTTENYVSDKQKYVTFQNKAAEADVWQKYLKIPSGDGYRLKDPLGYVAHPGSIKSMEDEIELLKQVDEEEKKVAKDSAAADMAHPLKDMHQYIVKLPDEFKALTSAAKKAGVDINDFLLGKVGGAADQLATDMSKAMKDGKVLSQPLMEQAEVTFAKIKNMMEGWKASIASGKNISPFDMNSLIGTSALMGMRGVVNKATAAEAQVPTTTTSAAVPYYMTDTYERNYRRQVITRIADSKGVKVGMDTDAAPKAIVEEVNAEMERFRQMRDNPELRKAFIAAYQDMIQAMRNDQQTLKATAEKAAAEAKAVGAESPQQYLDKLEHGIAPVKGALGITKTNNNATPWDTPEKEKQIVDALNLRNQAQGKASISLEQATAIERQEVVTINQLAKAGEQEVKSTMSRTEALEKYWEVWSKINEGRTFTTSSEAKQKNVLGETTTSTVTTQLTPRQFFEQTYGTKGVSKGESALAEDSKRYNAQIKAAQQQIPILEAIAGNPVRKQAKADAELIIRDFNATITNGLQEVSSNKKLQKAAGEIGANITKIVSSQVFQRSNESAAKITKDITDWITQVRAKIDSVAADSSLNKTQKAQALLPLINASKLPIADMAKQFTTAGLTDEQVQKPAEALAKLREELANNQQMLELVQQVQRSWNNTTTQSVSATNAATQATESAAQATDANAQATEAAAQATSHGAQQQEQMREVARGVITQMQNEGKIEQQLAEDGRVVTNVTQEQVNASKQLIESAEGVVTAEQNKENTLRSELDGMRNTVAAGERLTELNGLEADSAADAAEALQKQSKAEKEKAAFMKKNQEEYERASQWMKQYGSDVVKSASDIQNTISTLRAVQQDAKTTTEYQKIGKVIRQYEQIYRELTQQIASNMKALGSVSDPVLKQLEQHFTDITTNVNSTKKAIRQAESELRKIGNEKFSRAFNDATSTTTVAGFDSMKLGEVQKRIQAAQQLQKDAHTTRKQWQELQQVIDAGTESLAKFQLEQQRVQSRKDVRSLSLTNINSLSEKEIADAVKRLQQYAQQANLTTKQREQLNKAIERGNAVLQQTANGDNLSRMTEQYNQYIKVQKNQHLVSEEAMKRQQQFWLQQMTLVKAGSKEEQTYLDRYLKTTAAINKRVEIQRNATAQANSEEVARLIKKDVVNLEKDELQLVKQTLEYKEYMGKTLEPAEQVALEKIRSLELQRNAAAKERAALYDKERLQLELNGKTVEEILNNPLKATKKEVEAAVKLLQIENEDITLQDPLWKKNTQLIHDGTAALKAQTEELNRQDRIKQQQLELDQKMLEIRTKMGVSTTGAGATMAITGMTGNAMALNKDQLALASQQYAQRYYEKQSIDPLDKELPVLRLILTELQRVKMYRAQEEKAITRRAEVKNLSQSVGTTSDARNLLMNGGTKEQMQDAIRLLELRNELTKVGSDEWNKNIEAITKGNELMKQRQQELEEANRKRRQMKEEEQRINELREVGNQLMANHNANGITYQRDGVDRKATLKDMQDLLKMTGDRIAFEQMLPNELQAQINLYKQTKLAIEEISSAERKRNAEVERQRGESLMSGVNMGDRMAVKNQLLSLDKADYDLVKKVNEEKFRGNSADAEARRILIEMARIDEERAEATRLRNQEAMKMSDTKMNAILDDPLANSSEKVKQAVEQAKTKLKEMQSSGTASADAMQDLAVKIDKVENAEKRFNEESKRMVMAKQLENLSTMTKQALIDQEKLWKAAIDGEGNANGKLAEYEANLAKVQGQMRFNAEDKLGWNNSRPDWWYGTTSTGSATTLQTIEDGAYKSIAHMKELKQEVETFKEKLADPKDAEGMQLLDEKLAKVKYDLKVAEQGLISFEKVEWEWQKMQADGANYSSAQWQRMITSMKEAKERLTQLGQDDAAQKMGEMLGQAATQAKELGKELGKVAPKNTNALDAERIKNAIANPAQEQSIKYLKAAMKELATQIDNLDKTSKNYNGTLIRLQTQHRALSGQMTSVANNIYAQQSAMGKFISGIKSYAMFYFGTMALMMRIQSTVSSMKTLSDEMTNLRKVTGMANTEVMHLTQNLTNMDVRSTQEQLMSMAVEAGKLGIYARSGAQGVEQFVRAADKITATLGEDIGGAKAVADLVKVNDLINKNSGEGIEQSLNRIGSAILNVGNNSAASYGDVVSFVKQVGAVGSISGISMKQLVALGGTYSSLGAKMDQSATSINKMLVGMQRNAEKVAETVGLSAISLRDMVNSGDTFGALLTVLDQVNAEGGNVANQVNAILEAFGGRKNAQMTTALSLLINNTQRLREELGYASTAYDDSRLMTEEYIKSQSSLAGITARIGNEFKEAFVNPAMQDSMKSLARTMLTVTKNITGFIQVLSYIPIWIYPAVVMIGKLISGIILFRETNTATTAIKAFGGTILNNIKYLGLWTLSLFQVEKQAAATQQKMEALKATGGATNWVFAAVTSIVMLVGWLHRWYEEAHAVEKAMAQMDAEVGTQQGDLDFLISEYQASLQPLQEARDKQKEMAQALKETQDARAAGTKTISDESNAKADAKKADDALNEAEAETSRLLNEINTKYSAYLGFQLQDIDNADLVAAAHRRIADALQEEAVARLKNQMKEDIVKDEADNIEDQLEDLSKRFKSSVDDNVMTERQAALAKQIITTEVARYMQEKSTQAETQGVEFSSIANSDEVRNAINKKINEQVIGGKFDISTVATINKNIGDYAQAMIDYYAKLDKVNSEFSTRAKYTAQEDKESLIDMTDALNRTFRDIVSESNAGITKVITNVSKATKEQRDAINENKIAIIDHEGTIRSATGKERLAFIKLRTITTEELNKMSIEQRTAAIKYLEGYITNASKLMKTAAGDAKQILQDNIVQYQGYIEKLQGFNQHDLQTQIWGDNGSTLKTMKVSQMQSMFNNLTNAMNSESSNVDKEHFGNYQAEIAAKIGSTQQGANGPEAEIARQIMNAKNTDEIHNILDKSHEALLAEGDRRHISLGSKSASWNHPSNSGDKNKWKQEAKDQYNAYIKELDDYYTRQQMTIELQRAKGMMIEEEYNHRTENLEKEHLKNRAKLRNQFLQGDKYDQEVGELTNEQMKLFFNEADKSAFNKTKALVNRLGDAFVDEIKLKSDEDRIKVLQTLRKSQDELEKALIDGRPLEKVMDEFKTNMDKLHLIFGSVDFSLGNKHIDDEYKQRLDIFKAFSARMTTMSQEEFTKEIKQFEAFANLLPEEYEIMYNQLLKLREDYDNAARQEAKKSLNLLQNRIDSGQYYADQLTTLRKYQEQMVLTGKTGTDAFLAVARAIEVLGEKQNKMVGGKWMTYQQRMKKQLEDANAMVKREEAINGTGVSNQNELGRAKVYAAKTDLGMAIEDYQVRQSRANEIMAPVISKMDAANSELQAAQLAKDEARIAKALKELKDLQRDFQTAQIESTEIVGDTYDKMLEKMRTVAEQEAELQKERTTAIRESMSEYQDTISKFSMAGIEAADSHAFELAEARAKRELGLVKDTTAQRYLIIKKSGEYEEKWLTQEEAIQEQIRIDAQNKRNEALAEGIQKFYEQMNKMLQDWATRSTELGKQKKQEEERQQMIQNIQQSSLTIQAGAEHTFTNLLKSELDQRLAYYTQFYENINAMSGNGKMNLGAFKINAGSASSAGTTNNTNTTNNNQTTNNSTTNNNQTTINNYVSNDNRTYSNSSTSNVTNNTNNSSTTNNSIGGVESLQGKSSRLDGEFLMLTQEEHDLWSKVYTATSNNMQEDKQKLADTIGVTVTELDSLMQKFHDEQLFITNYMKDLDVVGHKTETPTPIKSGSTVSANTYDPSVAMVKGQSFGQAIGVAMQQLTSNLGTTIYSSISSVVADESDSFFDVMFDKEAWKSIGISFGLQAGTAIGTVGISQLGQWVNNIYTKKANTQKAADATEKQITGNNVTVDSITSRSTHKQQKAFLNQQISNAQLNADATAKAASNIRSAYGEGSESDKKAQDQVQLANFWLAVQKENKEQFISMRKDYEKSLTDLKTQRDTAAANHQDTAAIDKQLESMYKQNGEYTEKALDAAIRKVATSSDWKDAKKSDGTTPVFDMEKYNNNNLNKSVAALADKSRGQFESQEKAKLGIPEVDGMDVVKQSMSGMDTSKLSADVQPVVDAQSKTTDAVLSAGKAIVDAVQGKTVETTGEGSALKTTADIEAENSTNAKNDLLTTMQGGADFEFAKDQSYNNTWDEDLAANNGLANQDVLNQTMEQVQGSEQFQDYANIEAAGEAAGATPEEKAQAEQLKADMMLAVWQRYYEQLSELKQQEIDEAQANGDTEKVAELQKQKEQIDAKKETVNQSVSLNKQMLTDEQKSKKKSVVAEEAAQTAITAAKQVGATASTALGDQVAQASGSQMLGQLTAAIAQAGANTLIGIAEGTANSASQGWWMPAIVEPILSALLGAALAAASSKAKSAQSTISQATGVSAGKLTTGMLTYATGRYTAEDDDRIKYKGHIVSGMQTFSDGQSYSEGSSYTVDGADGKSYNAQYEGSISSTGIRRGTHFGIFSEVKPEMVVDGDTTALMHNKYPMLENAIMTLSRTGSLNMPDLLGLNYDNIGKTIQTLTRSHAISFSGGGFRMPTFAEGSYPYGDSPIQLPEGSDLSAGGTNQTLPLGGDGGGLQQLNDTLALLQATLAGGISATVSSKSYAKTKRFETRNKIKGGLLG